MLPLVPELLGTSVGANSGNMSYYLACAEQQRANHARLRRI
jgi:hypothetical protein